MNNKPKIILATAIGIGFWGLIIGSIIGDNQAKPAPEPAPKQETAKPKAAHPAENVSSFKQALEACPNTPACIQQGLLADYGNICKNWIKQETDKPFTASSEGKLNRIFFEHKTTGPETYRLEGSAIYDHTTGIRYWYGCEVNTQTGDIIAIAPPVSVGTKRQYKPFN
ncbi:hypothetical protein [uncultured Alcanivorax sp.]|jgi:hypothetical protein|uniref:hypothetical protein n=1 Tax=uncultured Alcanivorax sp. TaxID=191215 RepID=UPI0025F4555E|nr:hypothetical protein [uncultured Alcanivorax sp.]